MKIKKIIIIITAVILIIACNKNAVQKNLEGDEKMTNNIEVLDQLKTPKKGEEYAKLSTSLGDISIRLFPDIAPKSVENFKKHITDGYYDGIIFHRIIPNFMIQGGDPTGTGRGGESIWEKPFEDEFNINYRNFRGALSMANAGPNTNGSQFFIVHGPEINDKIISQMREAGEEKGFPTDVVDAYEKLGGADWLDGKHSVFGHVFEGMDIVDKIISVERNENDKPLKDIVIEKATIEVYN